MANVSQPLISVIIPVYNVENYLDRCLESIINQTYRNLEIILVDDGSNDGSGKKCDEYSRIDERVSVIHKENGGLSEARNYALDMITGEFVTFVDSDDYVDLRMIETLYNLRKEYKADISCVSFQKIFRNRNDRHDRKGIRKNQVAIYNGTEAVEQILYRKKVDTSPCGKLYKSSDFAEIRYPVGMIFEDCGTTYKLFYKKGRIVYSNAKMYFYVQRMGSIMHDDFSKKRLDRIVITKQIFDWASKECVELSDAAKARFFSANIQTIREMPLTEQWKEELAEIETCIKKYRKEILKNRKVKFIDRLIALSTYLGVKNLKRLGKLYKIVWP